MASLAVIPCFHYFCRSAKDGLEAPSDDEGSVDVWKVLEVSELFLMADLKAEVERISIKIISKNNVKEEEQTSLAARSLLGLALTSW